MKNYSKIACVALVGAGLAMSNGCRKSEKETINVQGAPEINRSGTAKNPPAGNPNAKPPAGNPNAKPPAAPAPAPAPQIKVSIVDADKLSQSINNGELNVSFKVDAEANANVQDYDFMCTVVDVTEAQNHDSSARKTSVCEGHSQSHKVTGIEANKSYMISVELKHRVTGETIQAGQAFFGFNEEVTPEPGTEPGTEPPANQWATTPIQIVLGSQYTVTVPRGMRILNYTSDRTIFVDQETYGPGSLIDLYEIKDDSVWSWSCHDFGGPYRATQTHAVVKLPDYENGFNPACFKRVSWNELRDITKNTLSRNQITLENTEAVRSETGRYENLIIRHYAHAEDYETSQDIFSHVCSAPLRGVPLGGINAEIPGPFMRKPAEFRSCVGSFILQVGSPRTFVYQLLSTDRTSEIIYMTNDGNITEVPVYNRIISLLQPM